MASAQIIDEGYEDERFESEVPNEFHCAICLNVLKQPMQCTRNEHSFCRPCILRYLQEFQRCPSCMEPLTIQTLRPSRVITAIVSQLKIKCANVERGCPDIVKLENLEAHIANCQLSPVKCSNEGCDVVIDRKDQAGHENNECIFRQGKCEVCGKNVAYGKRKLHCYVTKTEMGEVREEISTIKEIVMNMSSELTRHMGQMKHQMDDMKHQMGDMKHQMGADMKHQMDDVKSRMNDITVQVDEVKCEIGEIKEEVQNIKKEPQSPTRSLGASFACFQPSINIREDIIIAGGYRLKSVEMFSCPTRQWTLLPPMTSHVVFHVRVFTKVKCLSVEECGEKAR